MRHVLTYSHSLSVECGYYYSENTKKLIPYHDQIVQNLKTRVVFSA